MEELEGVDGLDLDRTCRKCAENFLTLQYVQSCWPAFLLTTVEDYHVERARMMSLCCLLGLLSKAT